MTEHINIDLETMSGLSGYPLQPWQAQMLTGFKTGEMQIISSGRQSGKSMFSAAIIKQMMDTLNEIKPITDLVFTEGKVYGARYYCVQPIGGSWKEMEQWCTDTFGKHGGAIWGNDPKKAPLPNERWYMNNSKFWFRNEKDRNWFSMRWHS